MRLRWGWEGERGGAHMLCSDSDSRRSDWFGWLFGEGGLIWFWAPYWPMCVRLRCFWNISSAWRALRASMVVYDVWCMFVCMCLSRWHFASCSRYQSSARVQLCTVEDDTDSAAHWHADWVFYLQLLILRLMLRTERAWFSSPFLLVRWTSKCSTLCTICCWTIVHDFPSSPHQSHMVLKAQCLVFERLCALVIPRSCPSRV